MRKRLQRHLRTMETAEKFCAFAEEGLTLGQAALAMKLPLRQIEHWVADGSPEGAKIRSAFNLLSDVPEADVAAWRLGPAGPVRELLFACADVQMSHAKAADYAGMPKAELLRWLKSEEPDHREFAVEYRRRHAAAELELLTSARTKHPAAMVTAQTSFGKKVPKEVTKTVNNYTQVNNMVKKFAAVPGDKLAAMLRGEPSEEPITVDEGRKSLPVAH